MNGIAPCLMTVLTSVFEVEPLKDPMCFEQQNQA